MDAWMTSARILHPLGQRRCAYGCDARDSLAHYARCRPMLAALRRALARAFPAPVLRRWGQRAARIEDYAVLAAAYA
eukprot:9098771-Pyramimonas_sp.AAC.1